MFFLKAYVQLEVPMCSRKNMVIFSGWQFLRGYASGAYFGLDCIYRFDHEWCICLLYKFSRCRMNMNISYHITTTSKKCISLFLVLFKTCGQDGFAWHISKSPWHVVDFKGCSHATWTGTPTYEELGSSVFLFNGCFLWIKWRTLEPWNTSSAHSAQAPQPLLVSEDWEKPLVALSHPNSFEFWWSVDVHPPS